MPRRRRTKSTQGPAQTAQRGRPQQAFYRGPGPMRGDKTVAHAHRVIDEKNFDSDEKLQAFVKEHVAKGRFPPLERQLTPVEVAEDLAYDAWDASGPRRIELARKALEVTWDCPDALLLLALEEVKSPEERRALLEEAVQGGERALGEAYFQDKEKVGNFWVFVAPRPYLRARFALAKCLWQLGEQQAAVAHLRELLRLNARDQQGVRYELVRCLFALNDDQGAGELMTRFERDGAAEWLYARALWLFRTWGPCQGTLDVLQTAHRANRYFTAQLLSSLRLAAPPPVFIPGSFEEGMVISADLTEAWRVTPGAIEWLRSLLDTDEKE